MAAKIKHLCKIGHMQHDVAARFGINQGRVSEIVNGKAHQGVAPDSSPPDDPQPELPF
jgi:predicted XRE-type DNA-binding protein